LRQGLETGMVANMLVTKNLALNKVAHVLAYLKIEIASHRDQVLLQLFVPARISAPHSCPTNGVFADG